MSRFFKQLATVISFIAVLAATSFASPMCAFCVPSSAQHHEIQSAKAAHDHCGSAQSNSSSRASVTLSKCAHSGNVCMLANDRVRLGTGSASSVQITALAPLKLLAVDTDQSASPPLAMPVRLRPSPLLLTTNLRV
jgi:hypothetical protein